jgi:hypothetical protein
MVWYAIIWIIFCFVIASVAKSRFDRDYTSWLLISLFASPLLGILALFMIGVNGKKCPQCAETIKQDAKICKHCGHKFIDDKNERMNLVDKILAKQDAKKSEAQNEEK